MAKVKHKILVLSGKGGVGKSTFSAQLAFDLASSDFEVGLLDIDLCGPSIPKMLGLEGEGFHESGHGWSPVYVQPNLAVMSIGFRLPHPDAPVMWRGPRKNTQIKQFLKDVYWDELDFLIVDAPPGTSDEHISIVHFLQSSGIDGAVIVTTPQQVSLADVRKEVNFCKKVGLRVLGVVENMSGLQQLLPEFGFVTRENEDVTEWAKGYMEENVPDLLKVFARSEVFDRSGGGGAKLCVDMRVPFLGKVPLDPQLCRAAEEGRSCFDDNKCRASADALKTIRDKLLLELENLQSDARKGGRVREMGKDDSETPENSNEHCPGPDSAGKSDARDGCPNQEACATAPKGPDPGLVSIAKRMATVKHKILVLSGKGGVGKSTFSAQLAFALASFGFQVGLLDIDLCGPSIPKMLGLEGQVFHNHKSGHGWSPVYVQPNLAVMSVGFMLPHPDEPVIWRGPRKNGLIEQFLKGVYWDKLDFLIVDAPPGTSDEQISIVRFLESTGIDGAVVVTTPQQVSLVDVRKEVNFCKEVGLRVLGVVENMSGLHQAVPGLRYMSDKKEDVTEWAIGEMREKAPLLLELFARCEVFDSSGGGGAKMSGDMGVPFLGKVPLDPELCKAAEEGRSCFDDDTCPASAAALKTIIDELLSQLEVNTSLAVVE